MNLEKRIIDLLYRYDCVIIPDFGGFVSQKKSAVFHPMDYTFDPPKKIVGFNNDLLHSDGLLAHELAKMEGLSYEDALGAIQSMVQNWKTRLAQGESIKINELGTFQEIDSKLQFTPIEGLNFSFDSFGMYPIKGQYILRENKNIPDVKSQSNSWTSYVAAASFAIILGASGIFANDNLIQPQLSSFLPLLNQESIQEPISPKKPVAPVISLSPSVTKETSMVGENLNITEKDVNNVIATPIDENYRDLSIKKYQVIGGSFKVYSQAMKHQAYLKRQGYDRAVIVGRVGNFYMVAIDTFENNHDAANYKMELEKKGLDVFINS